MKIVATHTSLQDVHEMDSQEANNVLTVPELVSQKGHKALSTLPVKSYRRHQPSTGPPRGQRCPCGVGAMV